MKLNKGRSNAESQYMLEKIPSDNQILNLLDSVSPDKLETTYHRIFLSLEKTGVLDGFRSHTHLLVSLGDEELTVFNKLTGGFVVPYRMISSAFECHRD